MDRRMKGARYRPLRTPADLARRLRSSSDAGHWRALTPAARRIASRWIGQAHGARVREWRVADVLRRAARYARGAGPFYPTADDQRLLARPRRTTR
jgi:hypothetical protein